MPVVPSTAMRQWSSLWADVVPHWAEWLCVLFLIALHTCLIFLVDVPGCGRGYLGPGGIGDWGKYASCTGGFTGWVDKVIFTVCSTSASDGWSW